jgi:S1-C subfamily serine protease
MMKISLFSIVFLIAAHAQDSNSSPPSNFLQGPIGSIEFDTTAGKSRIGSGSLVRIKESGKYYILTVRHLLGPNVDFPNAVAPQDVPNVVKGIHFFSLAGTDHYYSVTGLVIKPTGTDRRDPLFDLAVFPIQDPPDQTLTLSDAPLAEGETVWIVAHVRGGVPEGEIAHSAKVVKMDAVWLNAIYDNDKIDSYGASGAPVLNAAGEVVGVESGSGIKDGHRIAFFIPSAMILSAIKSSASP